MKNKIWTASEIIFFGSFFLIFKTYFQDMQRISNMIKIYKLNKLILQ